MTEEQAPRRVRVTGPRTGHRRRASIAAEIDAQTELGEIYMRSLMRAQLRLALGVVSALGLTLGILPLLFLLPAVRQVTILGIGLPWWLLGLLAYPLMLALAWFYVRRAERNERSFKDLVG